MRWVATDWLTAWLEAERDRLPLWLPIMIGAGVTSYYALRFEPPVWCGSLVALPALVAAVAVPRVRLLLAPVAAIGIGFAAGQITTARAPPIETDLPSHAVWIAGTIQSVEALPEGRRIVIRPASIDGETKPRVRAVRVRLRTSDDTPLQAGDGLRLRALIRPPAGPAYPGAWDLQRDEFYAGLGASGYALSAVEPTDRAVPSSWAIGVQLLREAVARRVSEAVPGAAGAVSVTLLTGSAAAIPPADHAAFRDSGLAHLLAVAGLHIGIVMGFTLVIARRGLALSEHASLFWPTRQIAFGTALAAGAFYMVLTGMHVPIRRSFLMACLLTLAILAGRNPVSLRGLALAATILMLLAPYEVPGVSFQMSFSAVLALIAGYEALRPWLRRLHGRGWRRRFTAHVTALALTSALAGTASAPFGAYHFGHAQAYFILANMAAVPLTALWVMPAGLIGLALMPIHLDALAFVPMGWGVDVILWVAHTVASLPAATFEVPHIPLWGLCTFSLGLAWLGLWRTRVRLAGLAIMAIALASPAFDHPPDLLISADARLIGLHARRTMLVQQSQGGGRFTRDSWVQYWAVTQTEPMPTTGDTTDGVVRCVEGACLLRPYTDRPGALLARGAARPPFCEQVSIIVSAEPARGLCPKPWPKLVDRFTVWRDGSVAVWLGAKTARVLTDRAERGDRPWVPPPPKPRPQPVPKLPPARSDDALRVESGDGLPAASGDGLRAEAHTAP